MTNWTPPPGPDHGPWTPPPDPPRRPSSAAQIATAILMCCAVAILGLMAIAVLGPDIDPVNSAKAGTTLEPTTTAGPTTTRARQTTTTVAGVDKDEARAMACGADAYFCGMRDREWTELVDLSCTLVAAIYEDYGRGISDSRFSEIAVTLMYEADMTSDEVDHAVVLVGIVWGAEGELCR